MCSSRSMINQWITTTFKSRNLTVGLNRQNLSEHPDAFSACEWFLGENRKNPGLYNKGPNESKTDRIWSPMAISEFENRVAKLSEMRRRSDFDLYRTLQQPQVHTFASI